MVLVHEQPDITWWLDFAWTLKNRHNYGPTGLIFLLNLVKYFTLILIVVSRVNAVYSSFKMNQLNHCFMKQNVDIGPQKNHYWMIDCDPTVLPTWANISVVTFPFIKGECIRLTETTHSGCPEGRTNKAIAQVSKMMNKEWL